MKNSGKIVKAFALMFTIVLFVGLISLPMHSNAAPAVQLAVTDASGKAGDEVTVSVNISPKSKLGAGELLLKYDTSKLTYKRHADGPAASGGLLVLNPDFKTDDSYKTMKGAFIHTRGVAAGGSLVDITFTIKSGWSGSTPLELTTTQFIDPIDYKEIVHTITNGSVTIGKSVTTTPAEPVTVPIADVVEVLGPDNTGWDKDYGKLNDEQKEKIEEHFKAQGTPVDVKSDGVYYITPATTKPPVKVPTAEVVEALGSDSGDWDFDYGTLSNEQKEVLKKRFAEKNIPVVIESDGVYFVNPSDFDVLITEVESVTVDASVTENESVTEKTTDVVASDSMSTAKKAAIVIAVICILLAAAVLIVFKMKKNPAE